MHNTELTQQDRTNLLYDEEFLMETFGQLDPDLTQRANHFFNFWVQCQDHAVRLKPLTLMLAAGAARQAGLVENRDFLIRHSEIRFRSDVLMSVAVLAGVLEFRRNE